VCAANRNSNGTVMLGVRHCDELMRRCGVSLRATEQGFITNKREFVTREEAWVIAEREGQIIRRCGGDTMNGGRLFSKNLY
jgi:hypothetical protein